MIYSFGPVCDENSRLLILGTAPSPSSLSSGFFYGHEQNRFWKLISDFAGSGIPAGIEEKQALLLKNGVALWDVLHSCSREGALDLDIRDPVPNDVAGLLKNYPKISYVFLNGSAALRYFLKFHKDSVKIGYMGLPSTSPANARYNYGMLRKAWEPVEEAMKGKTVFTFTI
jgi:hypoxanthine-DNA glycosylase